MSVRTHHPLPATPAPDPDPVALQQAWKTFQQLLPPEFFDLLDPPPQQTLYTPWVVTWLLVYQRIDHNATLNEAVDEFKFHFPAAALPDCRRVEGRAFSSNPGAYSRARSRLELDAARRVADHVADTLIEAAPAFHGDRRCFVFDGSSVLLQPVPALREAFPGATNQHGQSPFPVLHLAVAHELTEGMALRPEYGPMYGPQAVGEIALARRLMARLPGHSILLGDQNFGIFVFAWEAQQAGHAALLRLTKKRFASLIKKGRQVGADRWELTWHPSKAERRKYPELAADAQVRGWLIAREIDHPEKGKVPLCLFVTEDMTNEQAAGAYAQRLNIETDIKDLKRTLLLAELRGRSVAMVEKEVVLTSVAYNLVNQTRRLAARRAGVEPRRLSFKGVWSIVKTLGLSLWCKSPPQEWQQEFDRALDAAAQRKLANRKKTRQYPREVYMRRRNYPPRKRPGASTQTDQTSTLTHQQK